MRRLIVFAALCVLSAFPLKADFPLTPAEVVESGLAAHGGDIFIDPQTLALGASVFFDPDTGEIRSIADDYRMWREFERGRKVAHGADGKVRIIAKTGEQVLFEIGYDGEITWTQDGIMPRDQADAYGGTTLGSGLSAPRLMRTFL